MKSRESALTERPSWLSSLDIYLCCVIQHDVHEFVESLHHKEEISHHVREVIIMIEKGGRGTS